MAKSKSGGTRSYIRGRVGADVYSIGKDAKGTKQQVVRSLAETVANPQTQNQMRGRMIMSTVMQAVAALKPIIDHSFDNVSGRQPNISEFISRNYALVKADVAAHPSSGNAFGLNKYQEKGVKQGAYIIADGDAAVPAALVLTKASGLIAITMASDAVTIAGLKAALGMTSEEYFTLVGITSNGDANYERFRVNPTLAADTAITNSNIGDVFAVEGNAAAVVALSGNVINITLASVANCCAVIVSKKTTSGYIHNEAILGEKTGNDFNADAALPTYPVGAQDYLNGGDIYGQSESFNPAPSPSPSVSAPVISGTTPFQTSTSVTMSAASGAEIRYTLDGSTPSSSSSLYRSALTLTDTTTVKAIAIKNGATSSVTTKVFTKSDSTGRAITVDGVALTWGGEMNTNSDSPTIVVTLPEGDTLIGKTVIINNEGKENPEVSRSAQVTLKAGANTIKPSSLWDDKSVAYLGAGTLGGFPEYWRADEWIITLNKTGE
ncbi:MAG: chitobiase/beta-hexosaminidase C-terminal domain-containing protein [Prevotella sp.]|nr:chitobiase/beta-hexosaminidase C-terminal domain-containing protein [Prevotella sp.]